MRDARNTESPDTLRPRTLEGVPYDVAAGLRRHRELVAAGTALPAWVDGKPGARPRKWHWWLTGTLGVVLVTWLVWPTASPTRQHPAAQQPPQEALSIAREVQPGSRADAARVRATGEPAASPVDASLVGSARAAGVQPDAPSAPAASRKRAPGAARRTRAPEAPRAELAEQGDSMAPATSRLRSASTVVAPQDREEMLQLARAEQLLSAQPQTTLQLVRAGETQFPRGHFRQERRYLEVMALLALGEASEAQARGAWFLRDYPVSPYRKKIALALQQARGAH